MFPVIYKQWYIQYYLKMLVLERVTFSVCSFFLICNFFGWCETGFTSYMRHQLRMIDNDECGLVGYMRIGSGSLSTRRQPPPVPLCSPQIPHDMTWARNVAAAVGRRVLIAWAMAWPQFPLADDSLVLFHENREMFSINVSVTHKLEPVHLRGGNYSTLNVKHWLLMSHNILTA
jgi:hypothetical protein